MFRLKTSISVVLAHENVEHNQVKLITKSHNCSISGIVWCIPITPNNLVNRATSCTNLEKVKGS